MTSEAEDIARALGGKKSGDGWSCCCPAHDDQCASLSVSEGTDNKTLLTCHTGCSFEAITDELRRMRLWGKNDNSSRPHARKANGSSAGSNTPEGKLVESYDYKARDGKHLYYIKRYAEPKDFRRRPAGIDVNLLYRWPELVAAGPDATLFVTEGEKDCDRVRSLGFAATTVAHGSWGGVDVSDVKGRNVIILEDADDAGVKKALASAEALKAVAKTIRIVRLPGQEHTAEKHGKDVSDWLDEGHTADELIEACFAAPEWPPKPESRSLDEVHKAFRKWLGDDYDLDALDVTLAAAAAERLTGDPLWLLVVAGPGAAKTETVQALSGAGAHVTSTITSEGALLSASPRKSRVKTATGGLLRKIGPRGILVIKDVTSILSADRNIRGTVLAAIREIYDGRWERNVGTDGGQTLTWTGRIVVVGAVTTAWDTHHAVVATLGDRFVLVRIDSEVGRVMSGTRAIRNTGTEAQMREELADAVSGIVAHASTDGVRMEDDEVERLVKMADIVTKARTGVERDYRGDVTMAHDPEMPTRFGKQLTQVIRGGVAIGMSRVEAMRLAIRCARDSMPPLRLEILLDVGAHPGAQVGEVRRRIDKPWQTVRREMDALHMLGILSCDEETEEECVEVEEDDRTGKKTEKTKTKRRWKYELKAGFDRDTLLAMAALDPAARWKQPKLF